MSDEMYSAKSVRIARQKLIEAGFGAEGLVPGTLGVPESIERSWRRSLSQNYPQHETATPTFYELKEDSEQLLRAANGVLDRWNDFFTDMRIAMFVSDRNGHIIARRVAEPSHARKLDKASAVEGFDFSETALGTNGLGTPMEERRAVFVRGAEHVNDSLQSLACAGAPILDAVTGRVIGSVAIAAPVSSSNPTMLAIAKQAAFQVQQSMFEQGTPAELRSLLTHFTSGTAHSPAFALSRAGVISTTSALPWLSSSSQVLLWDELQSCDWSLESRCVSLDGRLATARRVRNSDGENIYLIELLSDGEPTQGRHMSEPIENASKLKKCLDQLAQQSPFLVISGNSGAGKAYLATEWLLSWQGRHPVTLRAEELRSNELLSRVEESLTSGSSVILTHFEDLQKSDLSWLKPLLLSIPMSEKGRLVFTHTGSGSLDLLKQVSPENAIGLKIPPLREDPERIVAIAQEMATQRNVVLSAEVLQALVRGNWPGEVRELTSLLNKVMDSTPNRLLKIDSLPPEFRSKTRNLFGIAASEYQAIYSALQEANWNRSKAANLLGIGRTTLYRKMRSYGLDGLGDLDR